MWVDYIAATQAITEEHISALVTKLNEYKPLWLDYTDVGENPALKGSPGEVVSSGGTLVLHLNLDAEIEVGMDEWVITRESTMIAIRIAISTGYLKYSELKEGITADHAHTVFSICVFGYVE